MPGLKDITGQIFGRLTVLSRAPNIKNATSWECKCACGTTKVVRGQDLKSQLVVSCGCYHREASAKRAHKHGYGAAPLRNVWREMNARCYNPEAIGYKWYGARGITVCPEWRNSLESFVAWAETNGYQKGLTLDRIDNDAEYSPANCRWVTRCEQSRNKSSNRLLVYKGSTLCITDLAKQVGLSVTGLRYRLDVRGMTVAEAVETPRSK